MKRLCGTVLIMEAIVVLLAILPASRFEHVDGGTAAGVGFGVAAIAFVLYGFLGRRSWALYAGSVFQLLVIATGVWVPMMYVLGVIFGLLWFTGIWLARKVEREQRAREAAAARAGQGRAGQGAQASEPHTQAG